MKIKEMWNELINGKDDAKDTEFLPSILEVVETPPSPTGRAVMWSVIALLVIGIAWAFLGHINEVAVANGKVVPTGQVKTIQVKNKGIIKSINVKEGEHVTAGQLLVSMDLTSAGADADSLKKRRAFFDLDIKRLEAELNGTPFNPQPNDDLSSADVMSERTLYQSRTSQHKAELDQLQSAVAQKQAALESEKVNYQKFTEVGDIVLEKEQRLEKLIKEDAISEFQYLEQKSQRIQYQRTAQAQKDVIAKAQSELEEANMKLVNSESTYKKEIMSALVEARKNYLAIDEELKKANQNADLTEIEAPCDGRVYNLAVHTVGGIVTDAQPLMIIVPDDATLEFEVWADNKDIGFIKLGQEAEVKVETFNFQKFGFVKAQVDEISADAYNDSKDIEHNKKYRLTLAITDDNISVFGQRAELTPGMEVHAEIKIKEKRIIDFFMDPFRKNVSESLRER